LVVAAWSLTGVKLLVSAVVGVSGGVVGWLVLPGLGRAPELGLILGWFGAVLGVAAGCVVLG